MKTHAAVGVQRQVGQAFGSTRVLDDDLGALVAVEVRLERNFAARGDERPDPWIVVQVGDERRAERAVLQLADDRVAGRCFRPPRAQVVGAGEGHESVDLGPELVDLCRVEHTTHVQVPGGLQEVCEVGRVVVERERTCEIEWCAVAVEELTLRVVHGATVEQRTQYRLPATQVSEVPGVEARVRVVENAVAGQPLRDERFPIGGTECDDRLGTDGAGRDVDRVAGARERVGATVVDDERERAQLAHVRRRHAASLDVVEQGLMEVVEVDGGAHGQLQRSSPVPNPEGADAGDEKGGLGRRTISRDASRAW
ncbi:unannotated protein [freshwater metagenome]